MNRDILLYTNKQLTDEHEMLTRDYNRKEADEDYNFDMDERRWYRTALNRIEKELERRSQISE